MRAYSHPASLDMLASVMLCPASLSNASCSAMARRGATARTNATDSASFSHGADTGTNNVSTYASCGTSNESPGW